MVTGVLRHVLMLQTSACVSCRVFKSAVMTLQEYLDHRSTGEAVPAIGLVTLAVKLLKVRACHRCIALCVALRRACHATLSFEPMVCGHSDKSRTWRFD